jgi:DEAD/DEAH box helicase domain-containing protein
MIDPILIYNELKEEYLKYIETAFSVDDQRFNAQRRELYLSKEHNILAQEPYMELIRPYPSSGLKIQEISIDEIKNQDGTNYFSTDEELVLFKNFCNAGLVGNYPIYKHQLEMIKRYAYGKNCIITTGTGSGKTESCLLPLFAYLAKSLNRWKNDGSGLNYSFKWFKEKSGDTPIRIN